MLLLTFTHNNKNLWAFTSSCYIIYNTMIKLNTIIVICQNRKREIETNRNQNQFFKPWGTRKRSSLPLKWCKWCAQKSWNQKARHWSQDRWSASPQPMLEWMIKSFYLRWLITKQSTWKNTLVLPTVTALILVGQEKKEARLLKASHFDCKLKTTSTTSF